MSPPGAQETTRPRSSRAVDRVGGHPQRGGPRSRAAAARPQSTSPHGSDKFKIGDDDFAETFFSVAFCAWALGDRDERLHDLDDLLGAIVERSMEQGWHGPVVDQIHHQVSRRLGYLSEEAWGR